jgi:hypothetical protein
LLVATLTMLRATQLIDMNVYSSLTSCHSRKSRNMGTKTRCYRAELFIFSGNYM